MKMSSVLSALRQSKLQKSKTKVIDVHSHVYLPRYMEILRSRTEVPYVFGCESEERLVILPKENEQNNKGRPIGREYFDIEEKLRFMNSNYIDISILSLANPWLDFLEIGQQVYNSTLLNHDMQQMCEQSNGRLYGFGIVPQEATAAIKELDNIASLSMLKGIILGTEGFGKGLDDPNMMPFYQKMADLGLIIFLHPHYGVGNEFYSGTGHSLALALGFTFETTVAVSRFILSGIMDQIPDIKLLLAHSGGTLPFLAGRLDSCVQHDQEMAKKLLNPPSFYLQKMYYDSIAYQEPTLNCLLDFVDSSHVMFGTDNPFFPPTILNPEDLSNVEWPSTVKNYEIMHKLSKTTQEAILSQNAEAKIIGELF